MTEFHVIMLKRQDGKVYADLHKTNQKIYLEYEDAEKELNSWEMCKEYVHIVKLIAHLEDVDDPKFLWYRMNETYMTWEVLIGESREKCLNNLELNEAFREYHKTLTPKRDIMII